MRINRGTLFMLVAVVFMIIAVSKATDGSGGSAVWIALGAAFIALGAAQRKKDKGGDDAR
ncbi:hypothetical protein OKA06_13885 [Novosphingobium sp. MW5]|nr:hypothetical protein [Novosphingobium sp. MW5]